jgi:hypothetical protein
MSPWKLKKKLADKSGCIFLMLKKSIHIIHIASLAKETMKSVRFKCSLKSSCSYSYTAGNFQNKQNTPCH